MTRSPPTILDAKLDLRAGISIVSTTRRERTKVTVFASVSSTQAVRRPLILLGDADRPGFVEHVLLCKASMFKVVLLFTLFFLQTATVAYSLESGAAKKLRPHIGSVAVDAQSLDANGHLDYVEHCLTLIESAVRSTIRPDYFLELRILKIKDGPIASGTSGVGEMTLWGPKDLATACHESFHEFQTQGWNHGIVSSKKRTSKGQSSPLWEAVPQVMGALGSGDCVVGREGRGQLAYDFCSPITWSGLPSLKTTATWEREIVAKMSESTSYWDKVLKLPAAQLSKPSAYYTAHPMVFSLHRALPKCGREVLIQALVATYSEESFTAAPSFDSIKSFADPYLRKLQQLAHSECFLEVQKNFRQVELAF